MEITLCQQSMYNQSYGFSSRYVWMWKLDHKEGWAPKNWCFSIDGLEQILENPLDCKEIKLVNPKGNQPWLFIEMTGAEAEVPMLWPSDAKNRLIGKGPASRKGYEKLSKQKNLCNILFPSQYLLYLFFFSHDLRPLSVNSTLKSISRKSCLI